MLRLRHPISLAIIALLVMFGVLRSFETPAPLGADAPDTQFSAARAGAILENLLQERVPHVSGSPANEVVGDRVVDYLESFGYEPLEQTGFHCNPMFGACSPVRNILAVKAGDPGNAAILLTAHYDSGWTGPGAADDGAGMASILEIARMSAALPPMQNDVIFLFTDSEENGLIGAHLFAERHPLFPKVKTVINLEARGVTGPSALFETGEGNRSLIRVFSKAVERPVGNSLVYEIYKRMPNDTDYTVYRNRGVMGANFAFAQGVPVYHSVIDDPEHLSQGSLQHHGDNAWSMMKALGDRDLSPRRSKEDAGFIDVFGSRLIHYPESITSGLALVLGVWVMLAIGVAFRKEFRFRQLRWGLLAAPFLLLSIVAAGYLLSFPLGRWPELHPLEHPYPWAGRAALLLVPVLAAYVTLKLFSGRVSACAWMIIAWALVFVAGIVLTSKMPVAAHIALLPLAFFAIGTVIDLFRRKSPAPLLMASVLGFSAAAFISFYHFFMLDVVLNFDWSHVKVAAFGLMVLVAMPMLLAFVKRKDLTWLPAAGLLAVVLVLCVVQWFLPGFTPDRPRDMTLMYSEVEGDVQGMLVIESLYRTPDEDYAVEQGFEFTGIDTGRGDTVSRPARPVAALGLSGLVLSDQQSERTEQGMRWRFQLDVPPDSQAVRLTVPESAGLTQAWVDGELALDTSIPSKHQGSRHALSFVYPGAGPMSIELLTESDQPFSLDAVTRFELPDGMAEPFMADWPEDAQPFLFGPRAQKVQEFTLDGAP